MTTIDYPNIKLSDFVAIIAKVYKDFYPNIDKETIKYGICIDNYYFIDGKIIAYHHCSYNKNIGYIYIN